MRKILSVILVVIMIICVFPLSTYAEQITVPEDYIGIYDIEDLYGIRYALDKKYILMDDINLTDATAIGGDWDNGHGWTPIGENSKLAFIGIFDGNGHTINGVQIRDTNTEYAGLFGYVKGKIINLNIENISLNVSNTKYVGGLVGYSENALIENVRVNGTIKNDCKLYDCYTGGIIGYGNADTQIMNCANKSEVYSRTLYINTSTHDNQHYDLGCSYAGGLIGYGSSVQIQHCFNLGNVTSLSKKYIEYIYRRSSSFAGGIAGYSEFSNINYCYNVGTIISNDAHNIYASGISYNGNINECINIGDIKGETASAISNGKISNCYYLIGTAPYGKYNKADTATTAIALTETQMKLKSAYGYLDFENVWFMDDGMEYPQLVSNPEKPRKKIKSVSIDDIILTYNSTTKINPKIEADSGANYIIEYKSSDNSVATVDSNGNVYGVKKWFNGTATITCTITDNFGNVVTDTANVTCGFSLWQWIFNIVFFSWLWD